MTGNDDYVLEILKDLGLIKAGQIDAITADRTDPDKTVLDILIDNGVISKMEVMKTLAMQLEMDVITLADHDISPEVIEQVPREIARRYKVVPVQNTENTLTVALSDPLNIEILDSLRYFLKRNVEGVVASDEEIAIALDHYYGKVEKTLADIMGQNKDQDLTVQSSDTADESESTESDAPIIRLVGFIILEAYRKRASDIHLEPMANKFRVRYRIDGTLHEQESLPKRLQPVILSRVKLMAGMKIAEKRVPQDGRIKFNVSGEDIDLRVSSVPASHGEGIVLRILSKKNVELGLSKLGFFADDQQTFEHLIASPDGIILITGPTGSGKTTTLYACLSQINRPDCKIITVEDPVEYQISGINQVQVREDIGLTFPTILRSILRQAPNIIMVGEIRDFDTAEIAINASLTGHLVFSTLHTNDAPSAITRLLDIGVKPFLLASSIRATMAQRLVRLICEKCKEPYKLTESQLKLMGPVSAQLKDVELYKGKGCNHCNHTGYYGRKGIFEIFLMNDSVRNMIYGKISSDGLQERAKELGMRTLREDGLRKVLAGITTIDEVLGASMGG